MTLLRSFKSPSLVFFLCRSQNQDPSATSLDPTSSNFVWKAQAIHGLSRTRDKTSRYPIYFCVIMILSYYPLYLTFLTLHQYNTCIQLTQALFFVFLLN